MENKKVMNRWLVVVGAILIQLALGAIYAWSVFTPGLNAVDNNAVAIVYTYGDTVQASAPLLGLNNDQIQQMNAELLPYRNELTQIEGDLKDEKDEGKKQPLQERKKEIIAATDIIVANYVPQEKIDELKFGFTKTQTQVVFSLGLAFFAIVMVFAGRKLKSWGPGKLAIIGGVVLGLGYIIAGLFAGKDFATHVIMIGVIGGSGIGLAYVVPIAVGMRWFPDKKGMITGLAVAGFGFGAMLWIKLAGSWGHLIANMGISTTFLVYGIAFAAMVIIGGIWMKWPPEGWLPKGYTLPEPSNVGAATGVRDFSFSQMLRTTQFYMIFLTFVVSAGAGLMSIGLMKLYPIEALQQAGIDAGRASIIAGTAMAVFFSLANGLGRILWGMISDKIGRKTSIIIMTATQGIIVLLFTFMAGNEILLYIGATLIGFNFGGNFALFPTITADTFGTKNVGQNYPFVFLAYGVGGIFGPMLGGRLGDLGNFTLAFTITGIAVLVGTLLIIMVKPPKTAQ
ncbi:MAG: OFA family MFS transporter [Bacteroidales bacterium]|nr:OFA family MFS transporter [Bacteroidales bacterium]